MYRISYMYIFLSLSLSPFLCRCLVQLSEGKQVAQPDGAAIILGIPVDTPTLGIGLRRIRIEVVDATDLAFEALLGSCAGHLVAF